MTLKQLQAEWRDNKYLTSQPEVSPRTLSAFTFEHCADSLTPFILQQEMDRQLIEDLLLELGNEINSPDWIKSDLYLIARSRLKEMEE